LLGPPHTALRRLKKTPATAHSLPHGREGRVMGQTFVGSLWVPNSRVARRFPFTRRPWFLRGALDEGTVNRGRA